MVFWIVSRYLVCWLPVLVTRTFQVTPVKTSAMIAYISTLILHLSVVINPLLNMKFRKELTERPYGEFAGGEMTSPCACAEPILVSGRFYGSTLTGTLCSQGWKSFEYCIE